MKQRWLKNINDGFIYGWDEYLEKHPLVKEVTEENSHAAKRLKSESAAGGWGIPPDPHNSEEIET